jgi:hypothetical protein
VKRREFITLLGGAAAAWPLAAGAQQPANLHRIGVLMGIAESDPESHGRVATFQQTLQELGWIEARNVRFDVRYSGGDAERGAPSRPSCSISRRMSCWPIPRWH